MKDGLIDKIRLQGWIQWDAETRLYYNGEWQLLRPGDLYLGETEHHTPDLLTVRAVEGHKRNSGRVEGFVHPETTQIFSKERKKKPYKLSEVVRVIIVKVPGIPENTAPTEAPKPNRNRNRDRRRRNQQSASPKNLDRVAPATPRPEGFVDYGSFQKGKNNNAS